jgi:hypothetical protein
MTAPLKLAIAAAQQQRCAALQNTIEMLIMLVLLAGGHDLGVSRNPYE